MIQTDTPRQNHLLNALPTAEYDRLLPHLERVSLPFGNVIYESGVTLDYGYFPTTCIVSKMYIMENGASSEIAVVGNDGIIGISLFMGGANMPHRAIVRNAGEAYRLHKQFLIEEFNHAEGPRSGALQNLLLRYTQALITQMAQTAVCNRHHSVDQQLCRWLLLSLDRLPSNEVTMTQELIANMLGVRREGVTEAAGKLQRAGLIEYSRGKITVLDRPGLEERVCECYQVVKAESDRLLPPPPTHTGMGDCMPELIDCHAQDA
ncbi:MAG: Crp/Fnr family transcriptional regulator [Methylococcaceae bacterium]|nr:Crp/Fnr family transcriptional regulator [Methylococcaceae bacterium]